MAPPDNILEDESDDGPRNEIDGRSGGDKGSSVKDNGDTGRKGQDSFSYNQVEGDILDVFPRAIGELLGH